MSEHPSAETLQLHEQPVQPKHYQPDTALEPTAQATNGLNGQCDERGYHPLAHMSWDQFNHDVELLFHMSEWTNWALGDLLNYAKGRWPNRYEHFCNQTGKSLQHLYNLAWVARVFPPEARHISEGIHWSHHLEVAGCPTPQQREEWLQAAIAGSWSRLELRRYRSGIQPARDFDPTRGSVEAPDGLSYNQRQLMAKFIAAFADWTPRKTEVITYHTDWGQIQIKLDVADTAEAALEISNKLPVQIPQERPDLPSAS